MEYDLLKYRGLQPDDAMPSLKLLYFYSKYKKDREDANTAAARKGNMVKMY